MILFGQSTSPVMSGAANVIGSQPMTQEQIIVDSTRVLLPLWVLGEIPQKAGKYFHRTTRISPLIVAYVRSRISSSPL